MKRLTYLTTGVFLLFAVSGCTPAPDLNKPGAVAKSIVDEHGVVCYTSSYKGEFSCVRVK